MGSSMPADLGELPLLDFIHALSPQLDPPYHLAEWCEMIEACLQGGVRGLCAIPIRHYKTTTTLHGMAWLLTRDPTMRIILFCSDHDRAQELGKTCRKLCDAAGIGPTRGENTIVDWKNEHGGGVCTMSAEQSRLGRDLDVLLFDDPIGSPADANDPRIRDAVDDAIAHYTARAGRKSRRGSVLGVMSPWHPDDPIHRRLARTKHRWTYVKKPAIVDMGGPEERAFAPDVMTLEEIKLRRDELAEVDPAEILFWAQFMCEPRSSIDAKVKEPRRYTVEPQWPGFRYAMGCDLAYQVGEKNDWFALVVCKFYGLECFVIEVVREKPDPNLMLHILQTRWDRYGRPPIYSYVAGPEKGALRYYQDKGIPIQPLNARWSKAYRSQATITRWNNGQVLVPMQGIWVPGFVARQKMFTGDERERDDDEMDALTSVCDPMLGSIAAGAPYGIGTRRFPRKDPKEE